MLKYLIVLGIITVIFYLLLYWRMRRYIPVARRIFSLTRDLYRLTRINKASADEVVQSKPAVAEKLVRCAACGTWIPANRGVRLKTAASTYCSTACLENAAAEPSPIRRSVK